jgi:UDP-N-acetyl-D-mannosaminuronate dehydrogenase
MNYKIGVIGLGYVGLTISSVLSDSNLVYGIDINEKMIEKLNKYETTIFEPGLTEALKKK